MNDKLVSVMKDGTETKALFVKNFPKESWEIVSQLQAQMGEISIRDTIIWAVNKAANRI